MASIVVSDAVTGLITTWSSRPAWTASRASCLSSMGSADEVLAKLSETPAGGRNAAAEAVRKYRGGVVHVVRLDVAGIVHEVAPRRADAAASAGTYLAFARPNRIVDLCSKRASATGGRRRPGRDG